MKKPTLTAPEKIIKNLDAKIERAKNAESFIKKVIYEKMYRAAQRKRWMTEGASEGKRWKRLSPTYEKYKRKRYASYPGAGRKMLIATGRLLEATVGPSNEHFVSVRKNQLLIQIKTPYARYVNKVRDFTTFSKKTLSEMAKAYKQYVMGGKR